MFSRANSVIRTYLIIPVLQPVVIRRADGTSFSIKIDLCGTICSAFSFAPGGTTAACYLINFMIPTLHQKDRFSDILVRRKGSVWKRDREVLS